MSELEGLRERLTGISAIPVTPFDSGGDVDELGLQAVVRRVVDGGADVVVACGNTSEQSSLTGAEWERVAALTCEASAEVPVLVGVGGDLRTAAEQTARAVGLGATGVMVHYPIHPYVSDAGLAGYYAAVAAATDGAVVPYVRGKGLSVAVLDRLGEMPNVVAVKYAVPDQLALAELAARYRDTFVVICGLAEVWAPFFSLAGARGFTSGLVNVVPRLSRAMLEALREGDYARAMEVWRVAEPFERLRARHGNGNNVPVVKEAMEMLGLIAGSVRPPLSPLDGDDRAELERLMPTLEPWV
jgi:4-hydroxy-tetrahydrodipicolinate synthase